VREREKKRKKGREREGKVKREREKWTEREIMLPPQRKQPLKKGLLTHIMKPAAVSPSSMCADRP
jgi:hypothetical protein